jgi:hypothetical protein
MLTITISARALVIAALMLVGAAAAVVATDALAGGSGDQIQGDVNCDQGVDNADILDQLKHEAGLDVAQSEPCTDIEDAFPLGTTIVGPSGPPGPSGAPGPPGINMWANITVGGAVEHGTATGAVRKSMGNYVVSFDTEISACTVVATVGPAGSGSTQPALTTAYLYPYIDIEPNQVYVSFQRPNYEFVDTDFHLIVVC